MARHTQRLTAVAVAFSLLTALTAGAAGSKATPALELSVLGTYASGVFAGGAGEIVAYDERSERLFVVNASLDTVDVLDASDPMSPEKVSGTTTIYRIDPRS